MPDTIPLSALEDMRSRHYRIDAPGLPGYPLKPGESMCGSDHHKWPCHAHILGGAVAAVLKLADRAEPQFFTPDGEPLWWDIAPEDIRAAVASALNGEETPA